ncbi:MAG: monooxygenase [Gammaproteobacteria bacterium]|jgi:hypothetical protein|nr:monooxygenase [Gammaproteobacteria bacterium]
MATLLQIDFPFTGPFGQEMSAALADLARSIAQEPGLVWKIWTENAAEQLAGGIYLFTDSASADAYLAMHSARLASFGITGIRARQFEVNEALTRLTRGPAA